MTSAQWIALTDLDPLPHPNPVGPALEVEGGELRGFKRNDHSVWSWLAVVGVTIGAQRQPVTDWESTMSLRHGGTDGGAPERVPASAVMKGPVPVGGVEFRRDNGLHGEVRVLCSGGTIICELLY